MLTPALLLNAYANGIFPMAEHQDETEVFWVDPRQRGVFVLDRFHISRSLARAVRRGDYTVSVDTDFAGVVAACADRPTTWINRELLGLYDELHALGHAHSLEVHDLDGALIGGARTGQKSRWPIWWIGWGRAGSRCLIRNSPRRI